MAHDPKKWVALANSGEVTIALVQARSEMIQLYAMLKALQKGDQTMFAQAEEKFLKYDQDLYRAINRIGGLDGPK